MVLIGDAKATAHFSIGSGTKLAMEDAIALFEAFRSTNGRDVPAALAHFETRRREEVEKTQHSADVSLVWFEHVERFWNMDPTRFAFGLMTRSKAITYDNLALRAPEFVAQADPVVARDTRALGFPADAAKPLAPMFQPFRLRNMAIENRVVVSPMCQYSAQDGMPGDWHLVHYGSRAIGGAGLMFTEMTDVSADARISLGCAGMYSDAHEAAWKRIVDFVHAQSKTKFCLQLGHAGRKGATKLMWEGIDEPLEQGAWPIISASPLPYFPHSAVPREMTRADMDTVIADFVAGHEARRARRLRHGGAACRARLSLASFISPLTNTPQRRIRRLAREPHALSARGVPRHARGVAGREADVRAHLRDRLAGWRAHRRRRGRGRAAVRGGRLRPHRRVDRPDHRRCRAGVRPHVPDPVLRPDPQRRGLATMCVGAITTADQVNTIIAAGRADLVALARPHLVDPYFTMKAAAWYDAPAIHCPPQYLAGKDQIFRNSVRDREELRELKLKAKPKGHRDTWKEAAE